jgi:hypothetical protein
MKNKKGISTIVEYVILIVIAISLTSIVYLWLKGFVPSDSEIECKDGVSISIMEASCVKQPDGTYKINLKIKNTGRYQLRAFHIKGTENAEDELPSIDLSGNVANTNLLYENEVNFYPILPAVGGTEKNPFFPNNVSTIEFAGINEKIEKIEITPRRVEEIDDKDFIATCKNARVIEYISCS